MVSGRNSLIVPRQAVDVSDDSRDTPQPLAYWRHVGAYVLLAEPGAGKTEAFKLEAGESGGSYTSARDFITLPSRKYETPIFIDGLDEIRAGSESHRGPLDAIRRRLDELGCPPFRLSCREADWRSVVDRESLKAVAPDAKLAELHLEELSDNDILTILRDLEVLSGEDFMGEAERRGVRPLLGNPLLLQLMVEAIRDSGDRWPGSRSELYRMACARLAVEYNEEHRAERYRSQPSVESVLDEAGLLCALQLLAGIVGFTGETALSGRALRVEEMPAALGVKHALFVLTTKLFIADADLRVPRHRTIAEFLAAGAIARRIEGGLPVERALALVSGADGGVVDPLRGLHAWLASRCPPERRTLIDRDPLGIVLYGDLDSFSTEDKKHVLHALHREAQRYPWFRTGHWEDHPFGAIGTADMANVFQDLLASPDRSLAHQSLLECVLAAIEHGELIPRLATTLIGIVRDPSFRPGVRFAALDAWLKQTPDPGTARVLLDDIEQGAIPDSDDELAGRLLAKLYPSAITSREVVGYLRPRKAESLYGLYQDFWRRRLVAQTTPTALCDLMDAWIVRYPHVDERRPRDLRVDVAGALLAETLASQGDSVPIDKLHKWLGAGVDKYGDPFISDDDARRLRDWLSARPGLLKALVSYGWSQVRAHGQSGRRFFPEGEARTYRASLPADWYAWLLEQAAATDDEELAEYCFRDAAKAALDARPDAALTMEQVEEWVRCHRKKWPQADAWLESAWSSDIDHWRREHAQRDKKHEAEKKAEGEERRRNILPYLATVSTGTAPASLMHQIALAYEGRFIDIRGDSPAERVQEFLSGTMDEALSAVAGLEAVLVRGDLPAVVDILKSDRAGRYHYIRPACLLGASIAWQRDPESCQAWSDDLARKLAAFWLTDGTGEQPEWFNTLAAQRPSVIAPVLEKFAVQRLRRRSETSVTGLWQLAHDERMAELARIVIPALLRAFPIRSNERQLRTLSAELLPAATRHLATKDLAALVAGRLALKSLDIAQRVAYLVAGLNADGGRYSSELLRVVGTSESRAAHLGRVLDWQGDRRNYAVRVVATVAGRLIELIAPYAIPEHPTGAHRVGDADRRRDWVRHFINQLASDPSREAANEIKRLAASHRLARWRPALESAAFDQARAARDATFRQASAEEVANVLANKAPANARDLAALVVDMLRKIEARLHGDDTNGLRPFRGDDRKTPKSENECRDILLDRLRDPLLHLGVHVEKEGQASQDTRADLRAEVVRPTCRFTVPIEIKKGDHRGLWSAWRSQLRSYVRDPASDGVGVYLVLWFGGKVRASPDGRRPATPQELSDMLSATIAEEEMRRLHIVVLDLSLDEAHRAT